MMLTYFIETNPFGSRPQGDFRLNGGALRQPAPVPGWSRIFDSLILTQ